MGKAGIRAPPARSANRPRWRWFSTNLELNVAIVLFGAALIGILWGAVAAMVRVEREHAIGAATARTDNLAIAFEQYSTRTIDSADSVIKSLMRESARSGKELDLLRFLAEHRIGTELLAGVAIADERGNAKLAAYSATSVSDLNVADREHFRVHIDRDDGEVFIGKPMTGRLTGKPVVPISRRIDKADGTFGGTVMAMIEPAIFTNVLVKAKLSKLDVISLVGPDGITRARLKGAIVSSGEDISKGRLFAQIAKGGNGVHLTRGHSDGVSRFFSYRTLPDYPLVAIVGTPEAEAMAGFYRHQTRYYWAAGLASAVITGSAFLLMLALASRKRAEEAMRQQHALLANAQRLGGMGIWELDVASDRVTWSAETHRIFGVDSHGFGDSFDAFLAFVHPADVERLRSLHSNPPSDGSAVETEYRIVRPDGEERVVIDRGETTLDAAGRPLRKLGVVMDITDLRRTENALREAQGDYRAIFENSTDGIFQSTPGGRVIAANPAVARMLGFSSPEELIRECIDVERQSYAQPARRMEFKRLLEERGSVTGFEYEVRRKDATTIWVSENTRVVRDDSGQIVCYEGSMRDITERRRWQEALQRQRAELRVLFDLVPAMIWFKDTENGIVRVNKRVAEAAGKSVEEIEGKSSLEIYPREAAAFYEADLEVIRSGVPRLGIVERLHDPQGRERWVETDKVPYFDESGKVTGIVVMAQDVSERKRAEANLEKNNLELREVSRQAGMSEVATNVLHNVGNVLNSVNVSASLMVESLRGSRASRMAEVVALMREHQSDLGPYITGDPKGRHIPDALERISQQWAAQQVALLRELDSLRGNIDHIKQIVALQQGYAKISGAAERVDVTDLIEDAMRVQDGGPAEHPVRIIREFEKMPSIRIEKHKVMQILVNLVRNAKLACEEQGDADKRITIRAAQADGHVRISVSDNGSGIAPANITRIFAHGFTTRKDGHGFGLHSGALAAVELGGRLVASSDGPSKGATFTLDLPMQPPKVAA